MSVQHEQIRAAQASIWERSQPLILQRVATVERAVLGLLEGHLADTERREAQRQAHQLAGVAGTFGFDLASQVARQLEELLAAPGARQVAAARAALLVERLHQALDPSTCGRTELSATAPTLLLVSSARGLTRAVSDAARARGLSVASVGDLSAAAQLCARRRMDAALVVLDPGGLPSATLEGLRLLASSDPSCVLTLASTGLGTSERLQAARAGVQEFADAHDPAPALVEAVTAGLRRARPQTATVLVVDDDPLLLAAVSELLGPTEMRPVTLADPMRLWEVLAAEGPDLIVLDIDMPGADGLQLCQLLRADDRWRHLPLLLLSSHEPERVAQLYAAGADDFVAKPIGPHLLLRLRSRLERVHEERALAETDVLTGLPNQRGLQNAWVHHHPTSTEDTVSFALLDVDDLPRHHNTPGDCASDVGVQQVAAALRSATTDTGCLAHLGAGHFAVLTHQSPNDAATCLENALEPLRRGRKGAPRQEPWRVPIAISAAVVPVNRGDHFEDAYRGAASALREVKAFGGDRIVVVPVHVGAPLPATCVDVVVVEDDQVVAHLLRHAAQSAGFSCLVINDGQEAIDQLTGARAPVVARTVLLDVDLPSRNGIEVLRSLRTAGVLGRTTVTMITGRTTEHDITQALAEGATDHIAKPFSIPVLAHKLRNSVAGRP